MHTARRNEQAGFGNGLGTHPDRVLASRAATIRNHEYTPITGCAKISQRLPRHRLSMAEREQQAGTMRDAGAMDSVTTTSAAAELPAAQTISSRENPT
jgi:hypothetical protein